MMSLSNTISRGLKSETNHGKSIQMLFAGDFCPGLRTTQLCSSGDYHLVFNDILDIIRECDISVVNLECPLTTSDIPINKVGPHLKADPVCAKALKYAGINVAALANNHIFDYGLNGIRETLDCLYNLGIKTVGAGLTADDAKRPLIVEAETSKIAFINIAENEFSIAKDGNGGAHGLDPIDCYYQIEELKKEAQCVVVIVHGGNEMYPLPSPRVAQLYRFFADIGAAAVIGHHTHCASGYEIYKDVPIVYSLGNFIFDKELSISDAWSQGFMVCLSVSGNKVSDISVIPYEQYKSGTGLRLLKDREKNEFLLKIEKNSAIIRDESKLRDRWKEFCATNEIPYLSMLIGSNRIQRALIRRGIGMGVFYQKNYLLELLNRIRCEAHRDVSIEILESIISKWK